jgi:hypothetical protein
MSRHFKWSLVKSVLRVGSGVALILSNLVVAGSLLIAAEVFGVVEEIGE